MASIGGMVAVKGKMPRVMPKFSRCCFCADKLTPGTTIEALFDYDPTKKEAAEQLTIYYAHPVCLKHKMRVGDIREVPRKPEAAWVTDWHIRRFWELWGEFKGIGAAVRAMLPIIKETKR